MYQIVAHEKKEKVYHEMKRKRNLEKILHVKFLILVRAFMLE